MPQNTPPGFGDLFGMLGDPVGAITKTIGQFQRGVGDFLSAVDNFNKTMEQMNSMANRINEMLDTLEEPIKVLVPQLTRTIKAADAMVQQLNGPVDRVAPGLSKLADVLNAPGLSTFPTELSTFMTMLTELAQRLQPLGQMAESAGGLFGLRAFSALRSSSSPSTPTAPPPVVAVVASAVFDCQSSIKAPLVLKVSEEFCLVPGEFAAAEKVELLASRSVRSQYPYRVAGIASSKSNVADSAAQLHEVLAGEMRCTKTVELLRLVSLASPRLRVEKVSGVHIRRQVH